MDSFDHLRIVGAAPACRSRDCTLPATGELGYCTNCEAVYRTAQQLRERLLARRSGQLHAAHRNFFDALSPGTRRRLLDHMAARSAQQHQAAHVFSEHGLEDFLAELRDLGLEGLT